MKTKATSKTFSLRVILLPEKRLSAQLTTIAREYSKYGDTYFVVDNKKYLVHLSLYFGKFPISDKQKIISVIDETINKHSRINAEFDKLDMLLDWLWIKIKLKGGIERLHKEILKKLSSFGKVHPYNSIKNYQPHLTLLRYRNKNVEFENISKKIKFIENNQVFRFDYVALSKGEKHGTVSQVIKKYRLSK